MYVLQGRHWQHKRYLTQLKPRYAKEIKTQQRNLPMEVLYNTWDMPTPIINTQTHCVSKRKRNPSEVLEMNPKRSNYVFKRECIL